MVREFNRYRITVAALQETKWFGSATYCNNVGRSVVLTAGRPASQAGKSNQRGESIAIAPSGPIHSCMQDRRSSGNLGLEVDQGDIGYTGKRGFNCLHVLLCYTPTFGASREIKDDLLDVLYNIR